MKTFNYFLFVLGQKLIFPPCCYFDFHRSSKKLFLFIIAKTICLPPPNPYLPGQKSSVISAPVRGWTCLLQVALLLNKMHVLPLHPKCLGSLSKNLSDSNENHLVSGEIRGVNHLFAGVHFPRKTQKQKFTSGMESDVPSVIFAC